MNDVMIVMFGFVAHEYLKIVGTLDALAAEFGQVQ